MSALREGVLFLTLAASALAAGGLALVSMGIVRATLGLDAQAWPQVHRALDRTIGPWMAALLVLSILGTGGVALALRSAPPPARLLFGLAAALFVAAFATSPLSCGQEEAPGHAGAPGPLFSSPRPDD
jgi:hypothetical protein